MSAHLNGIIVPQHLFIMCNTSEAATHISNPGAIWNSVAIGRQRITRGDERRGIYLQTDKSLSESHKMLSQMQLSKSKPKGRVLLSNKSMGAAAMKGG